MERITMAEVCRRIGQKFHGRILHHSSVQEAVECGRIDRNKDGTFNWPEVCERWGSETRFGFQGPTPKSLRESTLSREREELSRVISDERNYLESLMEGFLMLTVQLDREDLIELQEYLRTEYLDGYYYTEDEPFTVDTVREMLQNLKKIEALGLIRYNLELKLLENEI